MSETLVAAIMLAQFALLMLCLWSERRAKEYAADATYEARSAARYADDANWSRYHATRREAEARTHAAIVARMTAPKCGRKWAGEPNRAEPESPVGHA